MSRGFTSIELLVTLFVAAMALASGYQLYAAIIKEDSNTRTESTIGITAHEYVTQYSASATSPCAPATLLNNQSITVSGVKNVRVTVAIDCPNTSLANLNRVSATLTYDTPQKTLTHGVYVTPGGL